MTHPVRVLIVDDSPMTCRYLARELSAYEDIQVAGMAFDTATARQRIAALRPDVLTLDIELPGMNGLTFLDELMTRAPLPVIVVSAFAPRNSERALQALRLGAIDVLPKPVARESAGQTLAELASAICGATEARVGAEHAAARSPLGGALSDPRHLWHPLRALPAATQTGGARGILAIGASAGGTTATEAVLRDFPPDAPGTVIVQHMPAGFTEPYARSLDRVCGIEVREARDGDTVRPGLALIAPGGRHMTVERRGRDYVVRLSGGAPVSFHRPSVDVLLASVAGAAGHDAAGAILTGMGSDGAQGLLAMRQRGAHTVAQDESTCLVFGMPRQAILLGAVDQVVPLPAVAAALLDARPRPAAAPAPTVHPARVAAPAALPAGRWRLGA